MNNDLISREALKKAIAEFHQKENDRLHNPLWESIGLNALNMIIDYAPTIPLPDFKEGYKQAILDGKTNYSRQPGEWITVNERLPEDMQKVLIWFEYYRYGDFNCMYQTYGFGYVCDGKWSSFINGETDWQDSRVIAWQELPRPYKEIDK